MTMKWWKAELAMLTVLASTIGSAAPVSGSVLAEFASPGSSYVASVYNTGWDARVVGDAVAAIGAGWLPMSWGQVVVLKFPQPATNGSGTDIKIHVTADVFNGNGISVELWADETATSKTAYLPQSGEWLLPNNNIIEIDLGQLGVTWDVQYVVIKALPNDCSLDAVEAVNAVAPPLLTVQIDIKPGNADNVVNLGSQGIVPVAILSTSTFDATQVNPATVALSGANVALRGNGKNFLTQARDVNNDGLVDLVLDVETENFNPDIEQSGIAVLTGSTYAGQAIEGSDHITVVPPK